MVHPLARERRRRWAQLDYRDIIATIDNEHVGSVYIDDTGPAGNGTSPSLPPDRTSYVAAIVPSRFGREFAARFSQLAKELADRTGEREFHFAETFNGKRGYRKLDVVDRLAYFEKFTGLAEACEVTFIVQSLGAAEGRQWFEALEGNYPPLRKAFKLEKLRDLALFLLLLQTQDYLKLRMPHGMRAAVFVDEGWKKNNTGAWIGPWENEFLHGLVMSARSNAIPGLQLADFGAFMLNRSQFAFGKNPLSRSDRGIVRLWCRLGQRFLNVRRQPCIVREGEGGGLYLALAEQTAS